MSTLYFFVEWDHGFFNLSKEIDLAVKTSIRNELLGKKITADDIGKQIDNMPITAQGIRTSASVTLERIEPLATLIVDATTQIEVRNNNRSSGSQRPTAEEKDDELDNLVMFQTTFEPRMISHYHEVYESLVGIPKEIILREIMSLMMSIESKEKWSNRHYGKIVQALSASANKAPVIVFGGDPGTGKTALATSIGAKLATELNERVHFRHVSLTLRGMGYQGRASSMIVKLFDHIKKEYIRKKEPLILFFDEAEALVGSRGETDSSSGAQENIAVVDAIIVGVDNLRKGLHARVVALFATNLTQRVDSALMRRSYYHEFQRPDDGTREVLFKNSLSGLGFSSDEINEFVLATKPQKVNGKLWHYSHSDIVELIIGRAVNDAIFHDKLLTKDDILNYCKSTTPTASLIPSSG
ncbi:MAG: AAA family ATPase [Anaerolineales bacterium]|nr:MAG: AAA family ATPase [Anaerolineales bacterium]